MLPLRTMIDSPLFTVRRTPPPIIWWTPSVPHARFSIPDHGTLFETITLFDNRIGNPTLPGSWRTDNLEASFKAHAGKLRADTLGAETPIPINDWIDIGISRCRRKEKGKAILLLEAPFDSEPDPKFADMVDLFALRSGD